MPFKGVILYVAQFETKAVREAHLAETRDKKQLERHKRILSNNATRNANGLNIPNINSQVQGITWMQVLQIAMALRNINVE